MSERVTILEDVRAPARLRVDRARGVIHDVKVLGNRSANGRSYPPATIAQARALYEGRFVNVDHPTRPGDQTTSGRRFGWLKGLYCRDDGLYAREFHYLKSHPMAGPVTEAAERNPALFGLSHNAQGRGRRENGVMVIDAIESVTSVDLVADPATTVGLHESRGRRAMTLQEVIARVRVSRPGYARGLQEIWEQGIMGGDQPMGGPMGMQGDDMDLPPPPPDMPPAEVETQDHSQAILDAAGVVLKDSALDNATKLKKIKVLLGLTDDGAGAAGGGETEESSEDSGEGEEKEEKAEESRRLRVENKGLRLLMEAGVSPSKLVLRALGACRSDADLAALLEEAKGTTGTATGATRRPSSSGRRAPTITQPVAVQESVNGNPPEGRGKALVRRLFNSRN